MSTGKESMINKWELDANKRENELSRAFVEFSRRKLVKQYWPRLRSCVASLSEEQIWWRPNEASNSVGNLVLHLNGNVRQWLVASFGRQKDIRDRRAEFAARGPISAQNLLETLEETIRESDAVLARIGVADLLATYQIQGYTVSGLEAIYKVVEHFATHYGQILYITKQLRGIDLGFYRELDKTGRLPTK